MVRMGLKYIRGHLAMVLNKPTVEFTKLVEFS